jgi:inhibitor of cysteine peptidase
VALAAVLVLAAACKTSDAGTTAGTPSGEVGQDAEVRTYGSGDSEITAQAGGSFRIQLDENPTTGYRWEYEISDESVVGLQEDTYAQSAAGGNHAGGGDGAGGLQEDSYAQGAAGSGDAPEAGATPGALSQSPSIVGAGGLHTFTFSCFGAGSATVTFRYVRSWDPDTYKGADTVTYQVTVR